MSERKKVFTRPASRNNQWQVELKYVRQVFKSFNDPLFSCLYLEGDFDLTSLWYRQILSLYKSATRIDEHCLTAENIPRLVDKCVTFISTYGLELKGIYRKNGSTAEVRSLMNDYANGQRAF